MLVVLGYGVLAGMTPSTQRAVIMVGAYGPCAEFIKLAKEELPEAVFLNVSFVGSVPLMKALGDKLLDLYPADAKNK